MKKVSVDKYEGQFKDGKRHGRGTFVCVNGDKYEGQFIDDRLNGNFICTYANGDKYEGQFKDDLKNGLGTYEYVQRVELVSSFNSVYFG